MASAVHHASKVFSKVLCRMPSNGIQAASRNFMNGKRTLQKWELACAVCLERPPVVTREPTKLEKEFHEYLSELEYEKSLLSDHELRHFDDLELMEKRKQEDYEETETEAVRQTAVEAEDAWEARAKDVVLADRLTEADKTNDEQSYFRKLDRKLVLVVKQKLGFSKKESWLLPTGLREENETMREAAERILSETCGDKIDATFIGNAPCNVHKYKYSPFNEGCGTKVFIFKAQIQSGSVESTDHITDHKWITKEELSKHIVGDYARNLRKSIIEM